MKAGEDGSRIDYVTPCEHMIMRVCGQDFDHVTITVYSVTPSEYMIVKVGDCEC